MNAQLEVRRGWGFVNAWSEIGGGWGFMKVGTVLHFYAFCDMNHDWTSQHI